MNHDTYLAEIAGIAPPRRLRPLLVHLAGAGVEIVAADDRAGVHPFVIPLGREADGSVIGLLRWPSPPAPGAFPIVREGAHGLELLARTTDELLHRVLALRDADPDDDPEPLASAANRDEPLYRPGDLAASGLPLPAYLLIRAGVDFAFFEELVGHHLERGDANAALVTADRAVGHAEGWARPHAFRAGPLVDLGRPDEAADAARMALTFPVWTLGTGFAPIARLAGWRDPITSAPYHRLADDPERSAIDRAGHRMDAVAVDKGDWDAVKPELAARYEEGGMPEIATLIRG